MEEKKVLLYSGGTDSWLIDKLWKPDVRIYVNIHGFYSDVEVAKLPKDVQVIDFPFLGKTEELDTNFVPLRNLYFLMIASNYGNHICYGATRSDRGSKDKCEEFVDMTQQLFDYCLTGNSYTKDRHIKICKDFVKLNKFEIIQKYLDEGGTIEEFVKDSFSCYHSIEGKECMHCKQCYKKFLEALYFGYDYTDKEKRNMIEYLKTSVIPVNNHEGTYFTEREGEGPYMEKAVDILFDEYGLDWRQYR